MASRWETVVGFSETTSGSPPILQAPIYWVYPTDITINHGETFNDSDFADGTQRMYRSTKIAEDITGTIEMEVDARIIGPFLKWIIGDPVDTALAAGEHNHVYTPDNTLQEFFIFEQRGQDGSVVQSKVVGECKLTSATFTANAGEVMTVSINFVGRGIAAAGSHTAAFVSRDLDPFVFQNLTFSKANKQASLVQDTGCESFELTISRGVVEDKMSANNSFFPAGYPEGKLEVTGSFTREFDETTDYDAFAAVTDRDLQFNFAGSSMGSNNRQLQFRLPFVRLKEGDRGAGGGGNERMVSTFAFKALYEPTNNTTISVQLRNVVDSY